MESQQITIEGLVTQDGFLRASERIDFTAGPVHVTIAASEASDRREDTRMVLREIWAARKAHGVVARTKDAIDAEIDKMRCG